VKLILKIAIFSFVLVGLALIYIEVRSGRTEPIKDSSGEVIPGSIAALEKVELGGMEQWILIRGHNVDHPVLLWLHGGPGAAQMPIAWHFNGNLEREFIVVHWDQRGSGKSNSPGFDETTMTVDRYIKDTVELTNYLKERFGREKIYLLGHSWGSQIGILAAAANQEHYYAYIGVSQLVDPHRSQDVAYQWLLDEIMNGSNEKDLEKLDRLGPPRYLDHADYVEFAGLIDKYGGNMDMRFTNLAWIALQSPEYRVRDYYYWLQGATRGSGPMWEESQAFNLFQAVAQIDLPVYFFSGAHDFNTPLSLVEEYLTYLEAPAGKELVVFSSSAHTPYMAEPEHFFQELKRVKNETYQYSIEVENSD
jgi:pimeloyl-ACP methyl ester carboxylesterase